MKTHNRIFRNQPDFLLVIVRRPRGWRPSSLEDVPDGAAAVSRTPVASYGEARDDLLRCNRLAMQTNSRLWAVIECPGADL